METGWSTLCARRQTHKLIILQQIVHKKAPDCLIQIVPQPHSARTTRQSNKELTGQFQCITEYFKCSFFPATIDLWNNILPESARQMRIQFSNLKTHLYDTQCSPLCPCGEIDETIYHFFYNCKLFATARLKLYRSIFASFGGIYAPCAEQILYGNTNYNKEDNSNYHN